MKVLHILDSLNRGGVEMLTLDVCRSAQQNGLDLTFAATGGGTLETDFSSSGVDFHRFQRKFPIDPLLVGKLRSLIQAKQIDIVHTHQAVAGIHAYLATIGTGIKNVLTFHGFYSGLKERTTMNFLIPRVSANISCSSGLLEWLAGSEKVDVTKNFQVIYNGVDTERLKSNGARLRQELGLPPDTLLFGMVAHFYSALRKDQITLCRAFAMVAGELPSSHLILVGGTETGGEDKYEQCVTICREAGLLDRVHFLGRRDDVANVVNSLDIYVFSSLHEGLPIALLEAMLSKKPCLLSDIPPHLEVSDEGKYAEVFETQNAGELAEKLVRLGKDKDFRDDLANRGYEFARNTLTIESHIANLKTLYRSLLD